MKMNDFQMCQGGFGNLNCYSTLVKNYTSSLHTKAVIVLCFLMHSPPPLSQPFLHVFIFIFTLRCLEWKFGKKTMRKDPIFRYEEIKLRVILFHQSIFWFFSFMQKEAN